MTEYSPAKTGHYLFLEAYSFPPRALLGTDYVRRKITWYIFAPNGGYGLLIGHVRWLRGSRVKIANFSSFFCLSIPKRDLDTKKTTPNIEVWPESLRAMLEYWYIECGLLADIPDEHVTGSSKLSMLTVPDDLLLTPLIWRPAKLIDWVIQIATEIVITKLEVTGFRKKAALVCCIFHIRSLLLNCSC